MKRMLLLPTFVMVGALLAADNSLLGTWKLNSAKSKLGPGPGPQLKTATYTQDGDWIVAKIEGLGPQGQPFQVENRAKTDGKAYPYTHPPAAKGMLTLRQTDPHHWTAVLKLDNGGKITDQIEISQDGKTCTETSTTTSANGEKMNSVEVWERQ